MKINKLSLKNFKCFQALDLEFAKITLLTGANSSGKSSFLHSLMAILQTDYFPFYLSPNGKYVNMGSFQEIVFNHKNDEKIELAGNVRINNGFEPNYNLEFRARWNEDAKSNLPELNELQLQAKDFDIEISQNEKFLLSIKAMNDRHFLQRLKESLNKIENINKASKRSFTRSLVEIEKAEFPTIEELLDRVFINKDAYFISEMAKRLFDLFSDINTHFNYIGSFRKIPERTYYQKARANFKVDVSGDGYIDQILDWEEKNNPAFTNLNSWMRELQLFSEIKSHKINGGRFEFMVKPNEAGIFASLADVGFGISQFLPVIVADLQLPDPSILAVSQPEIHLHPQVQAALASYFVKQVHEKNKQYVIETHSEYLLNRIRLAIVREEIDARDVALYYFENSLSGSKIYPIELTKDGQIKNAPEGFFDTYMMDTMAIALNA